MMRGQSLACARPIYPSPEKDRIRTQIPVPRHRSTAVAIALLQRMGGCRSFWSKGTRLFWWSRQ